jgi:hypothetical protein
MSDSKEHQMSGKERKKKVDDIFFYCHFIRSINRDQSENVQADVISIKL